MVSLTLMNSWRLSDLWTVQILITQNQHCLWKSILQCIQFTSFPSLVTVYSLTLAKQTSQDDDWESRGKDIYCFLWANRFWQDLIVNTSGLNCTEHWVKCQTTLQKHLTSMKVLVKIRMQLCSNKKYQKVLWNGHFSYDEIVQKDKPKVINIVPGGGMENITLNPKGVHAAVVRHSRVIRQVIK